MPLSRSELKESAKEIPIDLRAWEHDCAEFQRTFLPEAAEAIDDAATEDSPQAKKMARGFHEEGHEVVPAEMANMLSDIAAKLVDTSRDRIHLVLVSRIAAQQDDDEGPTLQNIDLETVYKHSDTAILLGELESLQQKTIWEMIIGSLCTIAVRQAANILNLSEQAESSKHALQLRRIVADELKKEVIDAQGITILQENGTGQ